MTSYNKNFTKQSPMQFFIICLVFDLLLLFPLNHSESEAAVSSGKLVTHLPGLAVQPLPFHLETGYIGVGGDSVNQLFYYFVKSESNPRDDPLVLWLTGGPRCSGLSGLTFEIGPIYMIQVEYNNGSLPTLTLNPNSFTKIANIIFLDQPVNTGFSYTNSSHDDPKMSDTISAKNTNEFLIKWLIQNPEFQSNPLYISGDSYSGMIIPILVQDLIRVIEDGKHPFLNFKGYSLGNPVTHREMEINARVEYAYNMGFLSYELYQSIRVNCSGNFLNFNLSNPNCWRDRRVYEALISGINPSQTLEPFCAHDMNSALTISPKAKDSQRRSLKKTRDGRLFPHTCWRYSEISQNWANDDGVRKALHVKEGTVGKWNRCNRGLPYEKNVKSVVEYHRNISTKGYKILIYSGDHDMRVVRISTESWIRSLVNVSIIDEWRPWFVSGEIAGYTRTYSNGLTYATVKGAGHEAPWYKPDECYAMFERWISNTSL